MSFRDRTRGYHHGNLREAMVEAALNLIAERGPNGFTFAEVARMVGVSGAAPYRHFRDRNALMEEVALIGFQRFAADLLRAWDDAKPTPLAGLLAIGRAYLAFARREPAFYAAMFGCDAPPDMPPELTAASDRAFTVLRTAAETVLRAHTGPNRPPALMVALHVWSLSHGIASLFVGGPNGARKKLPMTPEDLLEAGVLIYLQSLGVVPA